MTKSPENRGGVISECHFINQLATRRDTTTCLKNTYPKRATGDLTYHEARLACEMVAERAS